MTVDGGFGEETCIAGLYFVDFGNPTLGAQREIIGEAPRHPRSPRITRSIHAHIGAITSKAAALAETRVCVTTRPAPGPVVAWPRWCRWRLAVAAR